MLLPVKRPLEQKVVSSPVQIGSVQVRIQSVVEDLLQPLCPLFQSGLGRRHGSHEALVDPADLLPLAVGHPGRLAVHVFKVDPPEIRLHLRHKDITSNKNNSLPVIFVLYSLEQFEQDSGELLWQLEQGD